MASRVFLALALGAAAAACGSDPVLDGSLRGGLNGSLTGNDAAVTGATGTTGGPANTTSTAGSTTGLPTPGLEDIDTAEPVFVDNCVPGTTPLTDAQVSALKAGGASGSARMLYPYDGTAFPRGIGSPLLMWEGVDAEAVYVHIQSKEFEFHGCLVPTAPGQLQLAQDVWDVAGQKTFGKSDPYTVELTWLSAGGAVGPIKQTWTMAQATLKGSVYYNSYTPVGQVWRIPAGGQAEVLDAGALCHGCHSVSANGERLISQTLVDFTSLLGGGLTFDLSSGTAQRLATPLTAPYAALTPDGGKYVSNSLVTEVARSVLSSTSALFSGYDTNSQLYETDTATKIPSQGLPGGALMPSFAPDGKSLVFNDYAIDAGQGLAMVQFDDASNTFSAYKQLYKDGDASMRPGWPFVLPDNGAVVFVNTSGLSFSADGAGVGGLGGELGPYSELFMVDVDTGASTLLAKAMGYDTVADAQSQTTYLPFGAADIRRAYFPTVSPVAAGGFFWVFFDAVRHYGNMGQSRQLWGTAIEISPEGDYAMDRSYPAFYLPGQVFGTGNHRAFTALDPCKQDGDSCNSGIDCCGGYCVFTDPDAELGVAKGTCASEIDSCAGPEEHCDVDADCCATGAGTAQVCINNFCEPLELI